ncbi:PIN domain-containing protein [Streptomyces griseoluteus]|uniref:PIN domain-containing protein n=1 Tax=Streptomyces griseoluteus TaxID=29306 RepID=UPI00380397B4
MLITPRPGAHREALLRALDRAHTAAANLQGAGPETAYTRLLSYLNWATDAADHLRYSVSDADLDRLVLTRRYHALLAGSGTLKGGEQERLINGLVNLEVAERVQALGDAVQDLKKQIERWQGVDYFVVADTSFYCHNPAKLADVNLHEVLNLPSGMSIRLLLPIAVVDELDRLKEAGKSQARWRAGHTLGLLDEVLNGATFGVWRRRRLLPDGEFHGDVNLEIVLDQPGHVRLPLADDEIVDRAAAIQVFADRKVRLLTCDTGQHTRGRNAGLPVTKVSAKPQGEEPDWESQGKPGTGVRAQRRAKQAEDEA